LQDKEWYTTAEVADLLGVRPETVRNRDIECEKRGGRNYYHRDVLIEYAQQLVVKPYGKNRTTRMISGFKWIKRCKFRNYENRPWAK